MELLLQKLDLLNVVNGTTPMPDPNVAANAQALAAWQDKDLSARLELFLYMEDAQKQTVRTLTTANQIWNQLGQTYEHTDVSSQVANLKKLMKVNMNDLDDVPQFI